MYIFGNSRICLSFRLAIACAISSVGLIGTPTARASEQFADSQAREISDGNAALPAAAESKAPLKSELVAAFSLSSRTLNTEDAFSGAPGTARSGIVPTFSLGWKKSLSPEVAGAVEFTTARVNLKDSGARRTEQLARQFSLVRLGGDFAFSERLSAGGRIGFGQEIFYRSSSANLIQPDRATLPRADLKISYTVPTGPADALVLTPQISRIFGGETDGTRIAAGTALRLNLGWKRIWENSRTIEAAAFLERRQQNTSILRKRETEIGVGIAWTWRGP